VNVSDCPTDSVEASFVTGHDFGRAAKRFQKGGGLQPLLHFELPVAFLSIFFVSRKRFFFET
jgi:hypothetical protein